MKYGVHFSVLMQDVDAVNMDEAIALAERFMEKYLFQHREDIWGFSISFNFEECNEMSED